MTPTNLDSEKHPRRRRCFVDLYLHPPSTAKLLSLGNIGRGEPRACPSRAAAGANRHSRWKTATPLSRIREAPVDASSFWIPPATSTGAPPIQIPLLPTPEMEKTPSEGDGERGTKVHNRATAAPSTTLPRHTHSPARSTIDEGKDNLVNPRSGGKLLNPTAAAGVEKLGGQTVALQTKTSLLLYKSGRRIRPLLHRRRARGPQGRETARTNAGELVASLVASLS
jgi:hypothetical protein